jgi:glutamate synthase (NADPH/NADH) large chain
MIGRTDFLDKESAIDTGRPAGSISPALLQAQEVSKDVPIHHCEKQDHGLDDPRPQADRKGAPALENKQPVPSICRSRTWTGPSAPCCRAKSPSRYGHAGLPTTRSGQAARHRRPELRRLALPRV